MRGPTSPVAPLNSFEIQKLFSNFQICKKRPTALVYRCAAPLSSGIDVFANGVHSLSSWGLVPSQATKSWHFGLGGLWAVPACRGARCRELGEWPPPEGMMSPSQQSNFFAPSPPLPCPPPLPPRSFSVFSVAIELISALPQCLRVGPIRGW